MRETSQRLKSQRETEVLERESQRERVRESKSVTEREVVREITSERGGEERQCV